MDSADDLQKRVTGVDDDDHYKPDDTNRDEPSSPNTKTKTTPFRLPQLKHLKWWIRVMTYILSLLVGQTAATLLGRLYYDEGGNSKWMATIVQAAGFPILLPLIPFAHKKSLSSPPTPAPPLFKLIILYLALGLILTIDNLLYSYGLLYLPVSTYSLLCATQLAFNAISAYFLNNQKFTILILNSLVLLTIAACLLAMNVDQEDASYHGSKAKYTVGFVCTLAASAMYSLNLSLIQLAFEKVIKSETFKTVLDMQIYPSVVATVACVVGLFASGEWNTLTQEMVNYQKGRVSYAMTLAWTAIAWQVTCLALLGLVFEVSSLFSNVISTLSLPMVPVFAVVFFHDKMNGVKVIALVLAVWGFVSYIYQHYLDDIKANKKRSNDMENPDGPAVEIC